MVASRGGYERLPTVEPSTVNEEEDENDVETVTANGERNGTVKHVTASETALHVDQLFKKWTAAVARKMRLKRREAKVNPAEIDNDKPVDIISSVFEVCNPAQTMLVIQRTLDHAPPMSLDQFNFLVNQVRQAIKAGMHPRLNAKGSSGSYFARDESGANVAIFKPKDEEPYGRLNPKFTKWVHRNFLAKIIPFGRACLIPQLSYLSEAAASLIDRRLESYIVPRTEVVELSSSAFFYDWIDRKKAKSKEGKPLSAKPGSFQVFMHNFTDASTFLAEHPYPGRPADSAKRRHGRRDVCAPFNFLWGRSEAEKADQEQEEARSSRWGWGIEGVGHVHDERPDQFAWTEEMMNSFRIELEKLVILDYLIRNTDRGLDNFMIKACPGRCSQGGGSDKSDEDDVAHMHIAAIDNSLAFPHRHPLGWRTYTYGWLYLPVSLIGRPFSEHTRQHYLPLLSSPVWWAQTTLELRKLFSTDPGFKEKMFLKQIAVMKGQALNIVDALCSPDDGPVELCRRSKKMVWDDFMRVADDEVTQELIVSTASAPKPSVSVPIQMPEQLSTGNGSRPVEPRSVPSTSAPALKRPSHQSHHRGVSSSTVLSITLLSDEEYGSLTGVSLMKHMDRIEAEDRQFKRSIRRKMPRRQTTSSIPQISSRAALNGHSKGHSEEYESESEVESNWGIASENDLRPDRGRISLDQALLRRPNERTPLHTAKNGSAAEDAMSRSTQSLDMNRHYRLPQRPAAPGRHRSDSATSLPTSPEVARRTDRANRRREGDIDEEDEWRVEDDLESGVRTKIVVVERLEEVKERKKWWLFWL